jgi:hypothetical protein
MQMMNLIRFGCGACALVLISAAALAQQNETIELQDKFEIALPDPVGPAPQNIAYQAAAAVPAMPAAGPGHTFEFISSEMGLAGKPVKGAPYSAEAVTESTQTLADGNRISRKNSTSTFRDREGRTRREVTLGAVGPWASAGEGVKIVFIHDPVAGVSYTLNEKDKTARKMEGNAMVMSFSSGPGERMHAKGEIGIAIDKQIAHEKIAIARTATADQVKGVAGRAMMSGPVEMMRVPAFDSKNAKTESLGKRNIEGVEAEGTRTTWTIAAGEIGNERPIDVVSERWYSAELQTVVMTRQSDPRAGETTYKLANLRRGDPARQLFEVPSDYTVVTEKVPLMLRKFRDEK